MLSIMPIGIVYYSKHTSIADYPSCSINHTYTSFKAQPSIYRFSKVDETLYRGGRPEPGQIKELADIGINTIVDLSTEKFKQEGYSEELASKNLGINYIRIPVVSGENPSANDLEKFFNTVDNVKNNDGKLFLHCIEGKDRTGLFVELYKIKFGLSDAQSSINTLIKARYNFSENPLAISFIKQFAESVKK